MSPELRNRMLKVIIRLGGTTGDAARALGCKKQWAYRCARRAGLRFPDAGERAEIRAKLLLSQGGQV